MGYSQGTLMRYPYSLLLSWPQNTVVTQGTVLKPLYTASKFCPNVNQQQENLFLLHEHLL